MISRTSTLYKTFSSALYGARPSVFAVLAWGAGAASAASAPIEVSVEHESLPMVIGQPAVLEPGASFPMVDLEALRTGELTVVSHGPEGERELLAQTLEAGESVRFSWGGEEEHAASGDHRLVLTWVDEDGLTVRDRYFFTALDRDDMPEDAVLPVYPGEDGALRYTPDFRGNRIPDFSHAGYRGGGVELPDFPVRVEVDPVEGDATARIQEAIDELESMDPDDEGIRGAVLLRAGVYEIEGTLRIGASGVVLRGEGAGTEMPDGSPPGTVEAQRDAWNGSGATVLLATGNQRRVLIDVEGAAGPRTNGDRVEISDLYVPLGERRILVEDASGLAPGDRVLVRRRGNAAWISAIGMDRISSRPDGGSTTQWSPFNLDFDREIESVEGNFVTIDAPLGNSVEHEWGGGELISYDNSGRIREVGIENLRAISMWEPDEHGQNDTRHADRFLSFDRIEDAWARGVVTEHFFSTNGAFRVGRAGRHVTIADCFVAVAPDDYFSGPDYSARTFRGTGVYTGRYGYHLQGQQTLVRDSDTIYSRHAFVVGSRVPGPNVFLDGVGKDSLTYSEPHHRWSVAGLYDNIDDLIGFQNRYYWGSGHGWSGANYVAWNTRGELTVQRAPTAQNWGLGHVGDRELGHFWDIADGIEEGYWEAHGRHVQPRSLYLQQLEDRLGGEIRHAGAGD